MNYLSPTNDELKEVGIFLERYFTKEGKFDSYNILYKLDDFVSFWSDRCNKELFIVKDGNSIVGAIGGIISQNPYNKCKYFAKETFWYVLPEYRNSGVGKELYRILKEWARFNGAHQFWMVSLEELKDVEQFYKNQGFQKLETTWIKELSHGT